MEPTGRPSGRRGLAFPERRVQITDMPPFHPGRGERGSFLHKMLIGKFSPKDVPE